MVNDGQAAIVVSQGKVISVYTEPGEHIFEDSEHSGLKGIVKDFGRRFTFAGDAPPITQRVYIITTKEIMGKTLETDNPIPIHIKDSRTGLSIDGSVSISGTYSYRITDLGKFYKFVGPAGEKAWNNQYLNSQMDSEMKTALQYAVYKLTSTGVRPSELPTYANELCALLKQEISDKWCSLRGIEIASMALGAITPHDMSTVQNVQYAAALTGKPYDFFEVLDEEAARTGVWRCECGAYTADDVCSLFQRKRPHKKIQIL